MFRESADVKADETVAVLKLGEIRHRIVWRLETVLGLHADAKLHNGSVLAKREECEGSDKIGVGLQCSGEAGAVVNREKVVEMLEGDLRVVRNDLRCHHGNLAAQRLQGIPAHQIVKIGERRVRLRIVGADHGEHQLGIDVVDGGVTLVNLTAVPQRKILVQQRVNLPRRLLCGAALQRERKQGKVLKFHGKCIAEGGRKGFPHGLHGENLTVPVVQNKSLVEFNLSAEHTRPPDCHIIQ